MKNANSVINAFNAQPHNNPGESSLGYALGLEENDLDFMEEAYVRQEKVQAKKLTQYGNKASRVNPLSTKPR